MTEQQPFELVRRHPAFELRRYPAHVLAELHVNATFDRAGNAAFRHLFNYISGDNAARQSISMTAPVVQGSGPSQKLAMTAPVPTNPDVKIRTVPGSLVAAIGFSGRGSQSAFEERNQELRAALTAAGLTVVGLPRFARFDPPFKPWFLRRNEVLQDVEQPHPESGAPG